MSIFAAKPPRRLQEEEVTGWGIGWESVYYKNMFYFRLFVVLVFVFTTIPMVAQDDLSVSEDLQSEAKSFRVYYPVNRTDLYLDYMENAENLNDLR